MKKYEGYFDFSVKNVAKCKLCPKILKAVGSTTGFKYHLEKVHHKQISSAEDQLKLGEPAKKRPRESIESFLEKPKIEDFIGKHC